MDRVIDVCYMVRKGDEYLCFNRHGSATEPHWGPLDDPFSLNFDTFEEAFAYVKGGEFVEAVSMEEYLKRIGVGEDERERCLADREVVRELDRDEAAAELKAERTAHEETRRILSEAQKSEGPGEDEPQSMSRRTIKRGDGIDETIELPIGAVEMLQHMVRERHVDALASLGLVEFTASGYPMITCKGIMWLEAEEDPAVLTFNAEKEDK